MGETSSLHRAIRILELLSMGRNVTASELYREFDGAITIRTLQRDMIAIQEAGIPLLCSKNATKENVWSFPRDYRGMVLPSIHRNELLSLYMLKAYLQEFRGTHIEKNLASVIEKLEDMAPGEVYLELDNNEEILWDQDFGAYDYSRLNDLLNRVIEAIIHTQWLTISYRGRGEANGKSLTVFPYRLFSYNGTIYLVAYLPRYQKAISLVLQRIISAEAAESDHPVPPFDVQSYRLDRFGVYGGEIKTVRLHIAPDYAIYFGNRAWHPSQKAQTTKDGGMILEMEVPLSPELVTWILGWHEGIRVLAPDELIDTIKDKIKGMAHLYNG